MRERVAMIQSRDIYFHIKDRDTMQLMTRNLLTSFFCLTFLSSATALTPLEAGQDPRVFIEQSMAGLTAQQVAIKRHAGTLIKMQD
jgi:hypothetical protein